MLNEIRDPLLREARSSPALLSDLAGLEEYIAESYDSRSFVELLQNADDAHASRFTVMRVDGYLMVANDGRRFNHQDFEGLCRSAASSKSRGNSIGYRGIGFKSVVGFARTIHLISGELEATFSRERTVSEIPDATRVPLIRIPHPMDANIRNGLASAISELQNDGFETVFIFDQLMAHGIENEFALFDPTSLLFLRNVREVKLRTNTDQKITVHREAANAHWSLVTLTLSTGVAQWLVVEEDKIALAFARQAESVIKLSEPEAVVHAFLPTLESTGFPIKIHGDISTDPSRTRVVLDDRTKTGIDGIANLILALLKTAMSGNDLPDATGIVKGLVPFSDPRIAGLQRRSFRTELFHAIQRSADVQFQNIRYRPTWLNATDFASLSINSKFHAVSRKFDNIEGLHGLLRFIGAKEAAFEEMAESLSTCKITVPGAAELVAHLSQRFATGQIDATQVNRHWRLWPIGDRSLTFDEAIATKMPLNLSFIDLVTEKLGSRSQAERLITAISDAQTCRTLMPESTQKKDKYSHHEEVIAPRRLSLKRWRSAEQQVIGLLTELGWIVEDVSRQNVGYDIEGRSPDGKTFYMEVKAIDYPEQPFTLTSNEEAVARQRGDQYQLVIVRQTADILEVAFVQNPTQNLKMTRQCRQWVWECSEYSFNPERYSLG